MNAFVFKGALLCSLCRNEWIGDRITNLPEDTGDSNDYPQGPYPGGGGEADSPSPCDACGCFLENPLTADGEEYVRRAVLANGRIAREAWAPFYSYLFSASEEENA